MTAPTNNRARSLAFVTAGPTEEPIDAVRFIGNRSSGRMGVALANALLSKGFDVVLALGPVRGQLPVASPPPIAGDRRAGAPRLRLERFCSSSDLERLMRAELPAADLVVMAAAVADFRPRSVLDGKMRRSDSGMQLELEGVPDLLTVTRDWRKAGACVIGFALEPRERLESSAREKLARKDLAGIVANPLETIDSADIDGALFFARRQHAHSRRPLLQGGVCRLAHGSDRCRSHHQIRCRYRLIAAVSHDRRPIR